MNNLVWQTLMCGSEVVKDQAQEVGRALSVGGLECFLKELGGLYLTIEQYSCK